VGSVASGAGSIAAGQQSALEASTKLNSGAGQLQTGLGALSTGASTLHGALATGLGSIPNPSEAGRQAMAQTIGNPIGVSDTSQATAGSYGAGLAPFFLSLALWIGAYVLFLLVEPLSSRALAAGQPSWRIAVGGWLPPARFGLGQAGLAFMVVFFGLGIHVAHPGAVLALMCFTSIAFVAILHALVSRLGAVGTFLGLVLMVVQLVLMVVQLVSAGGTFPWQTLPEPSVPSITCCRWDTPSTGFAGSCTAGHGPRWAPTWRCSRGTCCWPWRLPRSRPVASGCGPPLGSSPSWRCEVIRAALTHLDSPDPEIKRILQR
jgi:putative membrane protein